MSTVPESQAKAIASKENDVDHTHSSGMEEGVFMLECWRVLEVAMGLNDQELGTMAEKVMSLKLVKNHYEKECVNNQESTSPVTSGIHTDLPAVAASVVPVDTAMHDPSVDKSDLAWFRVLVFALFGGIVFQVIVVVVTAYSVDMSVGNVVLAVVVTGLYAVPYSSWPPRLTRGKWAELAVRFFSYRVIVEERVSVTETRRVIYVLGTSCDYWWNVPSTLQVLVHRWVLGKPASLLVHYATMYIPFFNILLQLLGVTNLGDKKVINQGRHVIVPLGGEIYATKVPLDAEDANSPVITKRVTSLRLKSAMKDIERLIASKEVVLVPCYCFGGHDIFAGSPFVPYRIPLLTVIGKSIVVPATQPIDTTTADPPATAPSGEAAVVALEARLATEMKRLFDSYKCNYSVLWAARELEVV